MAYNVESSLDPRVALCQRIQLAVADLPQVSAEDIPQDESCPICLLSFAKILSEEQELEGAGDEAEEKGITRLTSCGHMFCRNDLAEWIRSFHGSCPTCRHSFLDVQIPVDSDGESSDGDYMPDEEDEEEEDEFLDTDGFNDEFEVEMEIDMDSMWDDGPEDMDDHSQWGDMEASSEIGFDAGEEFAPIYDADVEPVNEEADTTLIEESTQDPK
ncbi:hypothetical protein SERLA73DRAFT_163758 [Serpula lacrymans var. lacrymans S7.3]|uniref:RING-type domain-containing protein n=2 Tax=Serpula lacrymans var. lacrymans TaxID=341189 RepID=F8QFC7_SERL3|nr:uncharacterized protein SERLADRAFT_414141 [Serpula lacrymans var. lacrymans S7.9]EGN93086.1 hypothetical protein SERLA73DRAFT_163758 [Serpula lacrymans var. lacrymans S7.3]EGO27918.1 hypothetical protein SERLADRAFT_414141 [Serpula lacrymans var. lacrymans S7.9]